MAKSPNQWMVHSYHNPSRLVSHDEVQRLLDKYGGSHHWVGTTCHVYILPELDTTVRQRGQSELGWFVKTNEVVT